jgi:hypothetical protein
MNKLPLPRLLATTFLLALLVPAAACGNSTDSYPSLNEPSSTNSSVASTGSGGAGSGGAGSGGATSTSTGTGGSGPAPTQVSVAGGDLCFTIATEATTDANPCTGDFVFLQGGNVDLESSNGSTPVFCPEPGTFNSLSAIPTDYTSCAWEAYVEGIGGLSGTGYILRDTAGTHHYRFWIVSDMGSDLSYEIDNID